MGNNIAGLQEAMKESAPTRGKITFKLKMFEKI